jgi:hypothetical protein
MWNHDLSRALSPTAALVHWFMRAGQQVLQDAIRFLRDSMRIEGVVMRKLMGFVFAGLLLTTAVAAKADTFDFTYTSSDNLVSATGILTGSLMGGVYDITSGTIDVTGGPVSGPGSLIGNLNFPGTTTNTTLAGGGTYLTYDDLLSPGSNPQLDDNGLLFEVDGTAFSIWGDGANTYEAFGGDYALDKYGTFAATAPEPSSLFLLSTGMLMAAGAMRRRLAAKS